MSAPGWASPSIWGEGYRLAVALAATLDQLVVERKGPHDIDEARDEDVATHWDKAYQLFSLLFEQWPKELEKRGCIDAAERRNQLLDHVAKRWSEQPPDRFVVAAGIVTTAPAVAGLLKAVADLPQGMVVFPGLDKALDAGQWAAIGPVDGKVDGGPRSAGNASPVRIEAAAPPYGRACRRSRDLALGQRA